MSTDNAYKGKIRQDVAEFDRQTGSSQKTQTEHRVGVNVWRPCGDDLEISQSDGRLAM